MPVFFSNVGEVHVYEVAELVAGLIEMQDHKGCGVFLCDLSDILISGDLHNLPVFLEHRFHLYFLHTFGHVLFGELILKIYFNLFFT